MKNSCEQIRFFWLRPGGYWISFATCHALNLLDIQEILNLEAMLWNPVEEKVDLFAEQEQAPVITHPFCSLKITESWGKKDLILSSYQPWKIPMWEWITKITPICVHGQHLFGWSVWTYFDMVSHWQLKKLFHHVMSCFDDMYLYLLLPTEITEIMDRPQPRKSNVFIRPGPKNNTSLHPPSATTGLSYQPKRQFHRLGAKGKNMKNEDLIKIWIFVQSIQASFNGPRGKLIRGKLAHLFQHRTVWRGQPPACQCWGGTPSSPGIVGDVPFKLDYINSMIS